MNQTVEKIVIDLNNLGVQNGDVLLVHSSFKSLGHVPGGIETVIQGLLHAVGDLGTLLMPALCWNLRPPEIFNPKLTSTNVGAIPEYFRIRLGTQRSIHPTHSACAVGKMTHELLNDHHLDNTPCGPNSSFNKITLIDAKILMLGCGLEPNTTMHALEEYAKPPYLFGDKVIYTIKVENGRSYQKEYQTHGFDGYDQRYSRITELGENVSIQRGYVLEAESFLIDTKSLRKAVLYKLKQDPLFFVEKIQSETDEIKPDC